MNMTMQELTSLLMAWPRSSDSPDEVILLHYSLTPCMAIVFTIICFFETARLIYAQQQQVGIPPRCWLDGAGSPPREGRGDAASSNFLLFDGDHREQR